jgi:hypothetical protein
MSATSVELKLKINFPVILFTVLLVHVLFFSFKGLPEINLTFFNKEEPTVLKVRQVKTSKVEHSHLRPVDSVLQKKPQTPPKAPTTLKDLGADRGMDVAKIPRPGSRPDILSAKKAINAISLKGKDFKDYAKSSSGGFSISALDAGTNKVSDAVVSIEVPDGIEPDELNKYELMFYSFQKRTAINYANSILKNLDKFNKRYPNYKLTDNSRIMMTARLTYDEKGNVKQIKMIRWTHVNEIQNFFEDVVKGIDQLHNPPKALWEKQGEFSMFFTLEIITG